MSSSLLKDSEYHSYYKNYIDLSTSESIVEGLKSNKDKIISFYSQLPEDKLEYAYAEGKWTPKDILLHLIDAERVFAYRALRIARQDFTNLAGFEQDDYVVHANANSRPLERLLKEYKAVREATILLFESFDADALIQIGTANDSSISVRAIGYIFTGHENHHLNVIKERYL